MRNLLWCLILLVAILDAALVSAQTDSIAGGSLDTSIESQSVGMTVENVDTQNYATKEKPAKEIPQVVHSRKGEVSAGEDPDILLVNIAKRQQYSSAEKESFDTDINSPKSAHYSADGKTLYINSLEGCRTVAYDAATMEKKAVVHYDFPSGKGDMWASPSGFYPFTHYEDGDSRAFMGKPVESVLSHDGRYLWVPFYRRTFDRNAQDPSAVAVVDTRTNEIVRMFETGPLPKMVAVSPDDHYVAVTHWGDNTVGLIDVSSPDMEKWHHIAPVTVGRRFVPDYPLDRDVNRDAGSGSLLRGTVFTPDGKWLLVSAMGGPLAVIDMSRKKCVATVPSLVGVRHLAISDGMVYGSKNVAGTVVKFSLDALIGNVRKAVEEGRSTASPGQVKEAAVGKGARTLDLSPDGRYIFVACNNESAVYVLKSADLSTSAVIPADSYPVGLAVSPDGHRLAVTSQGKKEGRGGNAVNIYRVDYGYDTNIAASGVTDTVDADSESADNAVPDPGPKKAEVKSGSWLSSLIMIVVMVLIIVVGIKCIDRWIKKLR